MDAINEFFINLDGLFAGSLWFPYFLLATGLFLAAVLTSAVGLLPLSVGLGLVVLGFVAFDIVPLRELYDSIEWPIIVLLGASLGAMNGFFFASIERLPLAVAVAHNAVGAVLLLVMVAVNYRLRAAPVQTSIPVNNRATALASN